MIMLDLFSGIGGFSLGAEMASPSIRTVAFCETEPYCRKVLKKHWPDVPIAPDIHGLKYLNGSLWDGSKPIYAGPIDIVCGGFPCQPYSQAGKRGGFADDRDLWPEMRRIIYETRPAWVIGENVAGFVPLGLGRSIDDLEGLGYEAETLSLPAYACGLPTLERHVWIVAARDGIGRERGKKRCDADAHIKKREGKVAIPRADQGEYHRWHLPKARVCGVGERVPGRVDRLRALGNAVPPPVVAEIFRAIMSPYNQRE